MATPTDVIIVFVGLALWSQQIPSDCGVKAILPSVEHTACDTHAHGAPASSSPVSLLPVQKHQAAIVFPRYSFISQVGWGEPVELPGQESTDSSERLLFIRLNHDFVRFLTNGAENDSANLDGLKLAHVQRQLCPAGNTLRPEYRPPFFNGAAAVVTLPEGAVQACLSVPGESMGRLDTRVVLKTNDTLGIAGATMKKDEKELRLKPRSEGEAIQLMIVNVPDSFFNETLVASEAGSISHMNVYLAMIDPGATACTRSLRQWWDQLDPTGIPLCNPNRSTAELLSILDARLAVQVSAANFECSNSQWP